MRVLMLSPAFPPELTGSGTLYYELAGALVAKGHRVTVIVARPRQRLGEQLLPARYRRGWLTREELDGIHVIRPATIPIPLGTPIGKGLDHLVLAMNYAIAGLLAEPLEAILVYSHPQPLRLSAWFLARRWRVPFVMNVQDIFPQYAVDVGILKSSVLIGVFKRLESFLYRRAARLTVHSAGNRQYLIRHRQVPPDKVEAIANWVDANAQRDTVDSRRFRAELGLTNQFLVVYGGTMGWAQGLDVVLDAAARLLAERDITFVLAGDGPCRERLVRRVANEGLDNVRILPLQPKDRYADMLDACDIGLISLNARLTTPVVPGKLFDIMASGRPVVGNVPLDGDAAQIVEESGAGLCVGADRCDELVAALLRLRNSPDLRASMGASGRQHVHANYDKAARTDDYERLLMDVAQETHRGRLAAKAPTERDVRREVPPW